MWRVVIEVDDYTQEKVYGKSYTSYEDAKKDYEKRKEIDIHGFATSLYKIK